MPERVVGAQGTYVLDAASRREGGQAEVFHALGPDGRSAAIRMPRQGDTGWFTRECSSIDDLTTRLADARSWMVAIVDRGVAPDGRPFAVLPWYEMNLTEWFRTGPPLERRLEALGQASRAVARLHQGGAGELDLLVHRDLKPSNFLVREDEAGLSVVLTDLGAARAGALLATVPNTLIYTRSYAPPEQQLPIHLAPDPTVDVHALGVTLFVGLTGRIPTAVLGREALRTADAQRLLTLDALGGTRSEAEEAEYRQLSHRPLASLLDLVDARPLFPGDEAVLRAKLADQLAGRCADAEAVAERIAAKVLPALHRALEPDPARRLGDARILQAACHHAVRILRQEGVVPEPTGVTTPPVSEPPDGGPTPASVSGEPSEVPLATDGSLTVAPAAGARRAWLPIAAGMLAGVAVGVGVLGAVFREEAPTGVVAPVAAVAPMVDGMTPPAAGSSEAMAGPSAPVAGPSVPVAGPSVPVAGPSVPVTSLVTPSPVVATPPPEVTPSASASKPRSLAGTTAARPVPQEKAPAAVVPAPEAPPEAPAAAVPVAATGSVAAAGEPLAPPRLAVECRPKWTLKVDGRLARAGVPEGAHALRVVEKESIVAESALQVARDGDTWLVRGPWVPGGEARVGAGGSVPVKCP